MIEPARTPLAIEANGLTKQFGAVTAVAEIDLKVQTGSVFAILGPNGAGKSVTIRMLTTLLKPDAGTASIFGHSIMTDAAAVRGCIALTGQFASVDEDMTGRDNLELLGRLARLGRRDARRRAEQLLEDFGLTDAAGKVVRVYSGGMRRRLDIAASLVRRPRLLFLDEPTTGLDPASRGDVWRFVRSLAEEGVTVLLTTQYLEEADRLADRIAVIDTGRLIAEGTAEDLKTAIGGGTATIRLGGDIRPADAMRAVPALANAAAIDGNRFVLDAGSSAEATATMAELAAAEIEIAEFTYGLPSLDDVFFALTGKENVGPDSIGQAQRSHFEGATNG